VHEGLAWLEETAEGREWLRLLPSRLDAAVQRWSLRDVGEPFAYAFESLAVPAIGPEGTGVVLKIAFPGRENRHEGAALERWAGEGAVLLLDRDLATGALLLERCLPGTPLIEAGQAVALDVLIDLLPRLWVPAGEPFGTLADEAAWWADDLKRDWDRTHAFERELLEAALGAVHDLAATQPEQVLLHQDLHAGNVLRAERQPWLAIDPKPLVGERAFAAAPIVRGTELGHSRDAVRGRLDRLCAALDLDEDRARRWTIAQTLAWCITDDGAIEEHVQVARWLM
jgi:streptomycin 6-kinase